MSFIGIGIVVGGGGAAAAAAGSAIGMSVLSAGVAGYGQYKQGKAQEAMAEYNAKVAENEALARQQAIEAESRELARGQREMKAQQRMSVAARGGLMAGTDLMALAQEAKTMQLDQLELQRQQDLAGIRGASEAAMSRMQGKAAAQAGRWTAGATLLQGAGQAASFGIKAKAPKGK